MSEGGGRIPDTQRGGTLIRQDQHETIAQDVMDVQMANRRMTQLMLLW